MAVGAGVADSGGQRERGSESMRSRNRWVAVILGLVALGFYVGFVLLHILK